MMATPWRNLAILLSVLGMAIALQVPATAQTGAMSLQATFFTSPLGDFPPPGSFFDPYGPVPHFLDRPLTRAELNRFYRGRLRVPRNRPYTFDPFFGPDTEFGPQGFFNFPVGPRGWSNGAENGGFFNFPQGFRGQLPSVLPGDNRGLMQVAPGVYYLPGREPGAFGRFQAPLPTPFRR